MAAENTTPDSRRRLDRRAWRQIGWLTGGAVALFVGFRLLPVGSGLNHMDFRVAGPNVIPFCDPANPAFIPVIEVRSPVELRVTPSVSAQAGTAVQLTAHLATASGKAIGEADLLESHTRKLHLLVVDPSLRDYQHLHPVPAASDPAAWTCEFTPMHGGTYRIFADFVPAATGRGLYAFADLTVAGPAAPGGTTASLTAELAGYRFAFALRPETVRAGQRAELQLRVEHATAGNRVPLAPVMGAFAHVVAFDESRSGFAHLHPVAVDPLTPPDPVHPRLDFSVEIPRPGDYVLWAQLNVAGREIFVPFSLRVQP